MKRSFRKGAVEGSTIVIILLSVALIGMGAFGIWAYISYSNAQTNLDDKLNSAAEKAKREQSEIEQKKYAEQLKDPNYVFNGPDDYGHVTFSYPKTWSTYVASSGADGKDFFAYLNPGTVPPVIANEKNPQRFAMRVAIYNSSMDDVLKEYQKTIEKGELSSEAVTVNGKPATKLSGLFPNPRNKDDRIRGVAYFFKVNDKVLMLKTDAETFQADFEKAVQTIKFS